MGDKVQGRPLSDTEKQLTQRTLEQQEYNVKVLKHNEKKFLLQLEELPLIERSLKDKLAQCRFELQTVEQAVKNAKETLQKRGG